MILKEYREYADTISDKDQVEDVRRRCISIEQNLSHLKHLKAFPENVVQGLMSIRASLLRGDCVVAEEQYLNLDVGNMVPENHNYWELKMDIRDLADTLVVSSDSRNN